MEAGSGKPDTYTYFPVFDTPEAYAKQSRVRVPSLSKMCYEAFDRIQPYRGGWGNWVWQLHTLYIIDKHRLLIAACNIPIGLTPNDTAKHGDGKKIIGPTAQMFDKLVFGQNFEPPIKPLEAGDDVGRFPATKEYGNVGFAFDIAINEADVITGTPAFLLLSSFADQVFQVVNVFSYFI